MKIEKAGNEMHSVYELHVYACLADSEESQKTELAENLHVSKHSCGMRIRREAISGCNALHEIE